MKRSKRKAKVDYKWLFKCFMGTGDPNTCKTSPVAPKGFELVTFDEVPGIEEKYEEK